MNTPLSAPLVEASGGLPSFSVHLAGSPQRAAVDGVPDRAGSRN